MAAQILLDNRAKKELKNLPSLIQEKILNVFDQLQKDPLVGIPLRGVFKGYRKVRIGEHRVVYKYFPKEKLIVVSRLRSRQGAYK